MCTKAIHLRGITVILSLLTFSPLLMALQEEPACVSDETHFDYGPHRDNVEAEQLAMHLAGTLRAPDEEYDRILRDLQLIRDAYPEIVYVMDGPDYEPNRMRVRLIEGEQPPEYDALNEYYQVTESIRVSTLFNTYRLTFCDNVNIPLLEPEYEALAKVVWASPGWFVSPSEEITVDRIDGTYRYTIFTGCGDCPAGCIYGREWVLDVDEAGNLSQVSLSEWLGDCFIDCCLPDATCLNLTLGNCWEAGGEEVAACLGDSNGDGLDDACCQDCIVACCLPDGMCLEERDTVCAGAGGTPVANCIGDANGDGADDACCLVASPASLAVGSALPADAAYPRNRFLAFQGGDPGRSQRIRVKLVDLPPQNDVYNGTEMWLMQPQAICENAGQGAETPIGQCGPAPGLPNSTFQVAALTCDPAQAYVTDWSVYGVIHTYDKWVMPGCVYDVQIVDEVCPLGDENTFSDPLSLNTPRFGDIVLNVTACPNGPPNGDVDVIGDVVALIQKFANLPCALSKTRADLEPADVDLRINITDAIVALHAFTGENYPFIPSAPPCP